MTSLTASPQSGSAPQKHDPRGGKYLTFGLGKEEFAIQVLRVREIMGIQEITAVPQMPTYVKGVLNLRGKVIPVVDLRLKFGLPELEYTQRTCIIVARIEVAQIEVAQIENLSEKLMIGIIVDGVSEVLTLLAADIEDTPDFGNGIETPYILGMAKIKSKVKILLDINRVFTAQEVERLEGVTGSGV
jgi:purine-binding chemotaxis protein CheW